MKTKKRTTVYFDANLFRALKMKAIELDCSFSDLLNDMAKSTLQEDEEDLQSIEKRKDEKEIDYKDFLAELKKDGVL